MPVLAIDMLGLLQNPKPHKNTRIFLRVEEVAENSSRVFFSHPQLHPCSVQTIYFLCTQFNPVYCSLWPPQEGCVLHIIFLFLLPGLHVHLGQVVEGFVAPFGARVPHMQQKYPIMQHTGLHPQVAFRFLWMDRRV